jgi:hypothetical protein
MGTGRGTVSHVTSQFSPVLERVEDLGRFATLQDGSWSLQRNQRVQSCSLTMAENCLAIPRAAGSEIVDDIGAECFGGSTQLLQAKRQDGAILLAFEGGRLA